MGLAVDSALRQTYSPLEIVLSDQGSTDRTFDVITDFASRYDGPNKVSVMKCRDTEAKGMAGLNRHIDCIMKNVDADVFIFNSADDWSHPDRTARVVKAFEDHDPDYVGTMVEFMSEDKVSEGFSLYPHESKFVTVKEIIENRIGGSFSCSWSRSFYERFGPIPGAVGPDTYLPPLAAFGKGYYALAEVLHVYFKHQDPENTGFWGMFESMKTDDEKARVSEVEFWQIAAGLKAVMDKTDRLGIKVDDESGQALMSAFISRVSGWVEIRHQLGLRKIPPMALPI